MWLSKVLTVRLLAAESQIPTCIVDATENIKSVLSRKSELSNDPYRTPSIHPRLRRVKVRIVRRRSGLGFHRSIIEVSWFGEDSPGALAASCSGIDATHSAAVP
jgi:hypothetical protein